MKSLVIGMGIGQLYKDVLLQLGHQVVTVDSDPIKNADFINVDQALADSPFDTVHICTPNFTHEDIANTLAPHAAIVFIEKPGVKTPEAWERLVAQHSGTRFMMVKNNQWRTNINELKDLSLKSTSVDINWINSDRVPNPGTWFTTKELAFGGVSRDLMPHLLSIFIALEPNYSTMLPFDGLVRRNWKLSEIKTSAYGTVAPDGTYNVDDECIFKFKVNNRIYTLNANWRSLKDDRINITFNTQDGDIVVPLGLCPEEAYYNMIKDAVENINNNEFWNQQYDQDFWIHSRINV